MYSFGNRSDTQILDEPFYAYYLHSNEEVKHPGRTEIISSQSISYDEVVTRLMNQGSKDENLFIKNMAHHLENSDWSFLKHCKNILLIRHPKQLIASFAQIIPNPKMRDIGLKIEHDILTYLITEQVPFCVIDSKDLLASPQQFLIKLCAFLDISFDENMLSWPKGPRSEDGVWAKYWYRNVHQTCGFQLQSTSSRTFPTELAPLLKEAMSYYNILSEYKI